MGMRGNIQIKQPYSEESIFLYTHWRGHHIKEILADAIVKAGGRRNDPSYFTRILFQEMLNGDESTNSFGISIGQIEDNEYLVPRVEWEAIDIIIWMPNDFETEDETAFKASEWVDLYAGHLPKRELVA